MTDLTVTGDSYRIKTDVDPNITAAAIRNRVKDYLHATGISPADPLVSPVFADLTGLPPLLIQAGSHERRAAALTPIVDLQAEARGVRYRVQSLRSELGCAHVRVFLGRLGLEGR